MASPIVKITPCPSHHRSQPSAPMMGARGAQRQALLIYITLETLLTAVQIHCIYGAIERLGGGEDSNHTVVVEYNGVEQGDCACWVCLCMYACAEGPSGIISIVSPLLFWRYNTSIHLTIPHPLMCLCKAAAESHIAMLPNT